MLDFLISQDELSNVSRLMTKARKSSKGEAMDITLLRTSARFVVTGRDHECDVESESPGFARLPVDMLEQIHKTATSFAEDPIRIRIEDGRIRVKSASLSHPDISLAKAAFRPIDVPDDTSAIDLLTLPRIFSNTEIEESALDKKVASAEAQLRNAVAAAEEILTQFAVTKAELSQLIENHIREHETKMRQALKP